MNMKIGWLLQLVGMVLLPTGLMMGLFRDNIALEVRLLFIGGGFFIAGWLLSRKTP